MSGESAFEKRHRKMVVPRGIALFGALLFIAFFVADRELISPSFPRDFVRISSRLDAWENRQEGFRLVLVSNDDRAQGFLEWGAQGLYGRVVEAKADGSARTFFLGDGGMNGIELTTAMRHGSIEVHYRPPVHPDTKGSGGLQEATVAGTRLKAADGLRILAAQYKKTQKDGRGISLRLQYLGAGQASQAHTFDEVLRRGESPYQMAAFRRAQQEEASLNVYQAPAELSQSQRTVQPEQSQRSVPPLEYEEIEYPVFISDDFVSVATQRYLFNGGAHGAASTDFDVIDRKTGVRLGLSDIFAGDDWKAGLVPLLKAELVRQHGFQNGQNEAGANTRDSGDPARAELKNQGQDDLRTLGLFEPDIWPSEDVFVCGSGIGFEYDRYQIAPWYMGEFILVLPWSEVKPYLSPALLSAGLFQ